MVKQGVRWPATEIFFFIDYISSYFLSYPVTPLVYKIYENSETVYHTVFQIACFAQPAV